MWTRSDSSWNMHNTFSWHSPKLVLFPPINDLISIFKNLIQLRLRIDLKLFQQLGPGQTLLKDARPSDQELLMLLADAKEEEKTNENPDELEEAKRRNLEAEAKFEQVKAHLLDIKFYLKRRLVEHFKFT
jgi:hypothetical protein